MLIFLYSSEGSQNVSKFEESFDLWRIVACKVNVLLRFCWFLSPSIPEMMCSVSIWRVTICEALAFSCFIIYSLLFFWDINEATSRAESMVWGLTILILLFSSNWGLSVLDNKHGGIRAKIEMNILYTINNIRVLYTIPLYIKHIISCNLQIKIVKIKQNIQSGACEEVTLVVKILSLANWCRQ